MYDTQTLIFKTDNGSLSFVEDVHEDDDYVHDARSDNALVHLFSHNKDFVEFSELNDTDVYVACYYKGKYGEHHHVDYKVTKDDILLRLSQGKYKEGVFFFRLDEEGKEE